MAIIFDLENAATKLAADAIKAAVEDRRAAPVGLALAATKISTTELWPILEASPDDPPSSQRSPFPGWIAILALRRIETGQQPPKQ